MNKIDIQQQRIQLINDLRTDSATSQKKGIHFMLASIPIWIGISLIQLLSLPAMTQNLMVFCIATPLVPIAYLISKPLGIKFSDKSNPLNGLGLLFTCNQILYILIAMWAYGQASYYFLMIYAMIFGAHLLPFSWLYQSRIYKISAIVVSITCLILGSLFGPLAVAFFMLTHQVIFCFLLWNALIW